MDCGPTCLRMIAKHYGKMISLETLRAKTQVGKEGVNLLGISEAAEIVGFRTKSVKLTYQALIEDAKLPAILHWKQNHFVVLYKVGKDKLYVADPATGLINFTRREFKINWISDKENGKEDGIALLLEPSPIFYESQNETDENPKTGLGFKNIFNYIFPYKKLVFQLFIGLGVGSDYVTGAKIWSNSYLFINKTSSTYFATTESLKHIEEQSNGDLSFIAYTTDSSGLSNPPYTSKSVNIITDPSGNLKKVISYDKGQYGTYPVAALNAGNGEKLVLIDDGNNAPLIRINNAGQILEKNAYNLGGTIAPVSLNFATSGYYIFLNDRGPYGGNSYLMKVDSTASIDCKEGSDQLFTNDVTSLFVAENILLNVKASDEDTLLFSFSPVLDYNYPLEANIECNKACCKDVMDTVVKTTLCEGSVYTLPDGYAVKDSGTYYISYKTAKGCDSVAFYHILFIKNPASLKIKGDECLEGKDTIMLKATSGFEKYNWINNITVDSNYLVTRPGIYWVSVSNSCGVKRDSIEIFDECEFPIYIPTAFTPDGNGLNDVFRVPLSNKNKFIRLQVYNRWGEKVFETKDISKGWDGSLKGKLQPVGVYVYFLNMESLNGNKITKHGVITLIR